MLAYFPLHVGENGRAKDLSNDIDSIDSSHSVTALTLLRSAVNKKAIFYNSQHFSTKALSINTPLFLPLFATFPTNENTGVLTVIPIFTSETVRLATDLQCGRVAWPSRPSKSIQPDVRS